LTLQLMTEMYFHNVVARDITTRSHATL
jgi:hypothetical protein